jgi:thymidylate synthase (FAD)
MEKKVLDHGFVRLVDHMPQKELDSAIVQAARVSYGDGTKTTRGDAGLIRYLMRHWHNTPFEMVEFKFHIKMPMYIARQHMRHRMASVNEYSARYSVVKDDHYKPEVLRGQSKVNHQGSEGEIDTNSERENVLNKHFDTSYEIYTYLLDDGVCREQARGVLTQSTYTEFYWKIDLHNLMHYLRLRLEPGAQKEIRDYASAIYELIQPLVPITMKAFVDFRMNAIQLSGPEIEAIANGTPIESLGERREFEEKLKLLGLDKNISKE